MPDAFLCVPCPLPQPCSTFATCPVGECRAGSLNTMLFYIPTHGGRAHWGRDERIQRLHHCLSGTDSASCKTKFTSVISKLSQLAAAELSRIVYPLSQVTIPKCISECWQVEGGGGGIWQNLEVLTAWFSLSSPATRFITRASWHETWWEANPLDYSDSPWGPCVFKSYVAVNSEMQALYHVWI